MATTIELGLAELGLPIAAAGVLEQYSKLLLEQNQVMNLTAITDPEAVAVLHMLDCAALAAQLDLQGKKVMDVGTGAGFPGMVLKIVEPSIQLTLLDALEKRMNWLQSIAPQLGVTETEFLHGRAEEYAALEQYREKFDVVTSRAVANLQVLCELALPFVKVGGFFAAMKSVDSAAEVEAAGRAVSILGGKVQKSKDYTLPKCDIVHRVVFIQKVKPTPEKYPRRFAKIKKTPL